ncbi:MAG TPA: hypothetical protein VNT77_03400 [Allosphingosinicella sp.]|nr:hypothetical protein [Allosphingosinicella sp.]
MSDEKKPNAGTHSADRPRSWGEAGDLARGDPEAKAEYNGRSGGGDSGGGAYPNPHSGKKPENDGFMGHGGQTEMPYHGGGQLGEAVIEGNQNAPAAKARPGQKKDHGERE